MKDARSIPGDRQRQHEVVVARQLADRTSPALPPERM
jgi:hypothetical protein